MTTTRRPSRPLAVVAGPGVAFVLALTGCAAGGGTGTTFDDGGGDVLPAAAPELSAAGVDVVSTAPVSWREATVVAALEDTGLAAGRLEATDLGLDPARTAGLLGVVGDPDTHIVLVFRDAASAAVFATGDPAVFADVATDRDRAGFLAGNLLAYTDRVGRVGVRSDVRRALVAATTLPGSTESPADPGTPTGDPEPDEIGPA